MNKINYKSTLKKIKYIWNIILAIILCPLFYLVLKKEKIWIIGFGNDLYENNLKFFNEYLLKKGIEPYLVFDKNFKHMKYINSKNKVLYRGHYKTYIYFFFARVLLYDTCNSDIAPGVFKYHRKALKVYINHGMEGIKKLPSDYFKMFEYDILCSVSEFEKEKKILLGADKEKIFITGYPRHDFYTKSEKKNILLFFTWREWFRYNKESLNNYVEKINQILNDIDINNCLSKKDIKIFLNIHAGAREYITSEHIKFNKNIYLIKEEENLIKYFENTSLLITDYSSIAWDFLYKEAKIIFYQFDRKEYIEKIGLLSNLEKINLGETAEDFVSFKNKLIKSIENIESTNVTKSKKYFFKYNDNNNSKRIYELILKMMEEK